MQKKTYAAKHVECLAILESPTTTLLLPALQLAQLVERLSITPSATMSETSGTAGAEASPTNPPRSTLQWAALVPETTLC